MLQESVQWKTSKGKAVKVCLDEGLFSFAVHCQIPADAVMFALSVICCESIDFHYSLPRFRGSE